MTLLTDLHAFYLEHRRCGDLAGDVIDPDDQNPRIWMTCTYGASIEREIVSTAQAME